MPRARKPWTKTVEVSGIAVRLYERGGAIYREVRGRDADGNPVKDWKSLGHGDRALAEQQARARAAAAANLPKLERGLFHPYRRLQASERKHLPDPDVAKAGGGRDLAVMRAAYQQADAATVLRVVENAPGAPGA